MSIKRNNLLLMYLAFLFTFGQLVLAAVCSRWGLYSLIPYIITFAAALKLLRKDGLSLSDIVPYNVRIKPLTALLIAVLVFLLSPLTTLLGQLGAMLGGDLIQQFVSLSMEEKTSVPELFFSLAVIPAVFEELFFRGFLYAGYKRARGSRFAIILTSILFGLFHMNIQQLLYASVLGIVLAVLRELTGSMWAGCLYHFVNNAWSAAEMLIEKSAPKDSFLRKLPLEQISFLPGPAGDPSAGTVLCSVIMLIVCTALALAVIIKIAGFEGRLDDLKAFFGSKDAPREQIITSAFIAACTIFVILTAMTAVLMQLGASGRI